METRELLLTPEEVSAWLRVPKTWLYQRIHTRTLPFPMLKVGKYVRFPEAGIRAYLEQRGAV